MEKAKQKKHFLQILNDSSEERETTRNVSVESEARHKKKKRKNKNRNVEQTECKEDTLRESKDRLECEKKMLEAMIERLEKSLSEKDEQLDLLKRRLRRVREEREMWREKYETLQYEKVLADNENSDEEDYNAYRKRHNSLRYYCERPKPTCKEFQSSHPKPPRNDSTATLWPTPEQIHRHKKLPKLRKHSNLLDGNSKDKFTLPALNTVQPMARNQSEHDINNGSENKEPAAKKINNNNSKINVKLPKIK